MSNSYHAQTTRGFATLVAFGKKTWIQAVVVDGWVNDQHVKNFRPQRKTKQNQALGPSNTLGWLFTSPTVSVSGQASCHDILMGKFSASCAWSIIKLRNFSTSMEISSQNLEANEGFRVEVDPTPTKNVPNLPLRAIQCTFSASEYRRHRDLIWHSYWLACTQNATAWHSIQIEVIVCFQLYLF